VVRRFGERSQAFPFPWNWSLKWKIPATIGVVIIAAILVFYYRLQGWHEKRLQRLIEIEMGAAVTMVSCSLEGQMLRGRVESVSSILESLAALDSIHHVRIFDPLGTVWMSSTPGERGGKVDAAELRSFLERAPVAVAAGDGSAGTPISIVTEPIRLRPECRTCHDDRVDAPPPPGGEGAVSPYWVIREDDRPVEIAGILSFAVVPETLAATWREEWDHIRWDFLVVILLFAVSLPLVLWWMVTRRIVGLERKMAEAREGDLAARASAFPADEIGALGERFNQLLARLARARKDLEEAHQHRIYHLERLSTVGELAARVAHEIKNPIAGISLGVKMLQKKVPLEQGTQETVAEIQHQVQRLNTVTRNLLNFSRSEPTRFESCSLVEILGHVERFVNMEGGSEDLRFVTDCEKTMPPILADAKLLEQALLNVVLNAQQAGAATVRIGAWWKTGGSLRDIARKSLRLQPEDLEEGAHVVAVSDDGPGIPDSQLGEVWKPFFTTKREGTGLGLAIVRQIVQDHGGDVFVESEEGHGTTFTLVLPLKRRLRSIDDVEGDPGR